MNWKPVPGYDCRYEVSDTGLVRRVRMLSPDITHKGYVRAQLPRKKGTMGWQSVHRLVYEAFIGPIPDGVTVNHKNGVKGDNRPQNLELMTLSEQAQHAYEIGLMTDRRGERHHNARLTEADVIEIRRIAMNKEASYADLASRYGVHPMHIANVVGRRAWKHI